jgi:hypothetical protein
MKCIKGHKNHRWVVNPQEPYSCYKICAHCNNKKLFEKDIDEWDVNYRNTRKPKGHFDKILPTILSDYLAIDK